MRFLALLCVPVALFSESRDMRGMPALQWTRHVAFEIVTTGTVFATDEPVNVVLKIRNKGYQNVRFYPDTTRLHTFTFLVLDRDGREIPTRPKTIARDQLTRDIVSTQGAHIKEMILSPGETFSREINLAGLYDFAPGERYRITAYFYPDYRQTFFIRSDNSVSLRLMPPQDRYRSGVTAPSSRPGITAEETVFLFLSAEMLGKWDHYFKYIDFPRYITAYDRFASRYAMADRWEREAVIRDFQTYLRSEPSDHLRNFKITGSNPQRSAAGVADERRTTVSVEAMREKNGYRVRYRYDYVLEKKEEFWNITHVTARVVR